MDDHQLQQWSDTLAEIRQFRQTSLTNLVQQKGKKVSPHDFVAVAKNSLDDALTRWWGLEEDFGATRTAEQLESLPNEMESVVDFELESIERDLDSFKSQLEWDDKKFQDDFSHLQTFADELKHNYLRKVHALTGEVPPPPLQPMTSFSPLEPASSEMTLPPVAPLAPPPPMTPSSKAAPQLVRQPRPPSVGRSGGGGVGMILMFFVGIIIGTGPSFYFWDMSNKGNSVSQDKISQLQSEKRALEDNIAVFQQNYVDLARGKYKTLPQLEEAIRNIREDIAGRRRRVEKEFTTKRESLMRKVPSGDRLDRSVRKLQESRDADLEALANEEKTRLEPHLKQMQIVKELMGG